MIFQAAVVPKVMKKKRKLYPSYEGRPLRSTHQIKLMQLPNPGQVRKQLFLLIFVFLILLCTFLGPVFRNSRQLRT